ncbi:MAG: TonB-dependent receptor [Nitrospirae bacterium]|nr:TonB-dependent receptor [Nitrospirota bacterium]
MKGIRRTKKMVMGAAAVGLSVLCFSPLSFANDATMEELISISTRTEKPVSEAPGSVSVVTRGEIEKRNIKSVDNILSLTPGVFNRRSKGLMDSQAFISLRGMPANGSRTLLMLDGVSLNDGYTRAVSYGGLAPEDVERVEVVRGPFSSLYGGNAGGGVVNVITRLPVQREFSLQSGYGTSLDRGDAPDDYRKYYLSYGDKIGDKLSLLLGYRYQATNGYSTTHRTTTNTVFPPGTTGVIIETTTTGGTQRIIGNAGDNGWWDDNISLHGGLTPTGTSSIRLNVSRSRSEYSYDEPHTYLRNSSGAPVYSYASMANPTPPPATIPALNESSFLTGDGGTKQNVYNGTYQNEWGSAKLKLSLGLVDQPSWFITPGVVAGTVTRTGGPGLYTKTPSKQYSSDLQVAFPVGGRNLLVAGGAWQNEKVDAKDYVLTNWKDEGSKTTLYSTAKGENSTYALFLQDEIMILENVTMYVGARHDWWKTQDGQAYLSTTPSTADYPENSKSQLSPKAALVYKPFTATTVRTSWGKAFRPPTVFELYRRSRNSATNYGDPNPDLIPETLTSWDLGVEQALGKSVIMRAAYFQNNFKNMIYSRSVTPVPGGIGLPAGVTTYSVKTNAGKAKGDGFELEVEHRPSKAVRLFTNYTYNDTEMQENAASPASVGKSLTYVPDQMFNIGGEFEFGRFSTSVTGNYVGKIWTTDGNTDKIKNVPGSYDPYFLLNAKVACRITKAASISLSADNILDRDYYYSTKAPGASWFSELTIKL